MANEQWYAIYEEATGALISTGTEVRSLHQETLDDVIKNEGGEVVDPQSGDAGSQPTIPAQVRKLKDGTKIVAIDGQPGPDDEWDTYTRTFKKIYRAPAPTSRSSSRNAGSSTFPSTESSSPGSDD